MRTILALAVPPRQVPSLSLEWREKRLDVLGPKEFSILLPDSQACSMPEHDSNCCNTAWMHIWDAKYPSEGGYANQAG